MASKNTYTGINPKVVKHLQCQSQRLKMDKVFANEDIEDVEQDLLLDCLPLLKKYDELAENYEAFVG
jgi:RNA polymerase sigma-70 factor (ECF subfamily)